MERSNWLVIAVSGATCSGKTTLARNLNRIFRGSILLHQDDYFLDVRSPRHVRIPQLNHINFEILSSLDNDGFLDQINSTLTGPLIPGIELTPTCPVRMPKCTQNLLILDGFLLLNEPRIAELCDLKFYITVDEQSCWGRRSMRTYGPPDPPGYFELCVWPNYLRHFEYVRTNVDGVIYLDGTLTPDQLLEEALNNIIPALSK